MFDGLARQFIYHGHQQNLTDVYAKMHTVGSASPNSAKQVKQLQWSIAAREWKRSNPDAKVTGFLIVKH